MPAGFISCLASSSSSTCPLATPHRARARWPSDPWLHRARPSRTRPAAASWSRPSSRSARTAGSASIGRGSNRKRGADAEVDGQAERAHGKGAADERELNRTTPPCGEKSVGSVTANLMRHPASLHACFFIGYLERPRQTPQHTHTRIDASPPSVERPAPAERARGCDAAAAFEAAAAGAVHCRPSTRVATLNTRGGRPAACLAAGAGGAARHGA